MNQAPGHSPATSVSKSSVLKRTRACLECGSSFLVNPCHAEEHGFCRPACRARWHRRHPRQKALDFAPPLAPVPKFDGETVLPEDRGRLARQLEAVKALMCDGRWRTLAEIARECRAPEASVSARLRDLRKRKFGEFWVERRRLERGLHAYRVIAP